MLRRLVILTAFLPVTAFAQSAPRATPSGAPADPTAWRIDKYKDYKKVRKDISAVKAAMPKVFHDVAARALQVHGSLGVSDEMPFSAMVIESFHMGLADGPTEVHKVTVARQVLSEYQPAPGLFPTGHLPARRAEVMARYADVIEGVVQQL